MTGKEDRANARANAENPTADPMNNMAKLLETMNTMMSNFNTNARSSGNNTMTDKKIMDCPLKRMNTSLDCWLEEDKMWDEALPGVELARLKYISFMKSVRSSEDCKELQEYVETNIAANESVDKASAEYIKNTIKMIKENLGKTSLEKATDAWIKFVNIKQEASENIKEYVNRFENVNMEMKNAGIKLPAISLTIQLMYKSNLEEASKENIMTKVNMDEHQTIFSETVKAMREMKSMTSAGTKTNETLFSDYQRQGYAGRKSVDRFRSRNGRSRNREGRSRTRDDRNREGRSRNRDDRSRDRRSRNREYIRSRDRSGYRSRYRSSERNRSKGRSDGY